MDRRILREIRNKVIDFKYEFNIFLMSRDVTTELDLHQLSFPFSLSYAQDLKEKANSGKISDVKFKAMMDRV